MDYLWKHLHNFRIKFSWTLIFSLTKFYTMHELLNRVLYFNINMCHVTKFENHHSIGNGNYNHHLYVYK